MSVLRIMNGLQNVKEYTFDDIVSYLIDVIGDDLLSFFYLFFGV